MSLAPRTRTLSLLIGALAACSDPRLESFDPMASSQKAQEAFAPVTSSPAVQNFTAVQGAFTWSGAPPVYSSPGAASVPSDILPGGTTGKLYTYSTSSGKYAGTADAGVPAGTARFTLYQVSGGAVQTPLAPVGQLDLVNQDTPTPNTLGVVAAIEGATLVDYRGRGSLVGGVFSANASGFVSDGVKSLDFEVSQNFAQATGLRIDYRVSTPDITLQAVAEQTGGSSSPATVTLTVTEGPNKLEVMATGTSTTVNGTVEYNGHRIARITGTGDAPMFAGQGGRTLSPGEIQGLQQLFDFVDVLFVGIDEVLIPLYFVLGFHP